MVSLLAVQDLLRRAHCGISAALLLVAVAASAQTQAATSVAEPARRAATLRVQPGDRIALIVLRERELTDTVMVNERGEAAFAKLGMLRVDSLTMTQLQDTLRTLYGQFLRNPAIEISVLRRVAVNGEVRYPNVYMVDVSTTLRDVIAKAGGVTDNGNKKKVDIVRDAADFVFRAGKGNKERLRT
jgi:protein involved in polysaccharide export with SLBB domain